MSLATLEQVAQLRAGRVLVTTNGVFDLVHAGHVALLEEAKGLGDVLVVALNSDLSAQGLGKGAGRPYVGLEHRARVVAALRCVDAVVSFDEPTPEEILAALRPDVHVKGGDYKADDLPERRVVEEGGGRVAVLPYVEGFSTTAIIERIAASLGD
ncbi:MAG: adenylyltransferase/cytidyltransferase family protein [Fimbriimonadaceae bacterium]